MKETGKHIKRHSWLIFWTIIFIMFIMYKIFIMFTIFKMFILFIMFIQFIMFIMHIFPHRKFDRIGGTSYATFPNFR